MEMATGRQWWRWAGGDIAGSVFIIDYMPVMQMKYFLTCRFET